MDERLLKVLRYQPHRDDPNDFEDFEIFLKTLEYSYINHDYASVQQVLWAAMTLQDVEDHHTLALTRVLTDLSSSSPDLWFAASNSKYAPELKSVLDRFHNTADWISRDRLWRVFVVPECQPDPVFLPVFQEFYDRTRAFKYDDDEFDQKDPFEKRMMEVPYEVARKINTADVKRSHSIEGQFELSDGSAWKFVFEDSSDYDSEWHNPLIRFERVTKS